MELISYTNKKTGKMIVVTHNPERCSLKPGFLSYYNTKNEKRWGPIRAIHQDRLPTEFVKVGAYDKAGE